MGTRDSGVPSFIHGLGDAGRSARDGHEPLNLSLHDNSTAMSISSPISMGMNISTAKNATGSVAMRPTSAVVMGTRTAVHVLGYGGFWSHEEPETVVCVSFCGAHRTCDGLQG